METNNNIYGSSIRTFDGVPVVECEEGTLGTSAYFMLVFGLLFGGMPAYALISAPNTNTNIIVFISIFIIVGMAILFFGFVKPLIVMITVANKGYYTEGILVDWEVDNSLRINGRPVTCMLIRVTTEEGDKVIRFQTGNVKANISVGTKMQMKIFNNMVGFVKPIY